MFGRTLRTSFYNGLSFTPQHTPTVAQSDVHLPDGLSDRINDVVHSSLKTSQRLAKTPLAGPRGLLLHGPPGTGKSSICKVLAAQLAGVATVVEVTHLNQPGDLRRLCRALPDLSPAWSSWKVDTLASRRIPDWRCRSTR